MLRRQRAVGYLRGHRQGDGQRQVRDDGVALSRRPVAIETDFPDVKASTFGFFPIPIFDNQLQPVHPAGPTKFIYSKSPARRPGQAVPGLPDAAREPPVPAGQRRPEFATLPFTGVKAKWDDAQTEFLDTYPAKATSVYQDVVNYLNPQWIDIGKDMVSMFTGSMTPADVMASIDQRRTDLAKTASDPAWPKCSPSDGRRSQDRVPRAGRHHARGAIGPTTEGGTATTMRARAYPTLVRLRAPCCCTRCSSCSRACSGSATRSPTGTATPTTCTGSASTTSPRSCRRDPTYLRFILNTVVFTVATIILKTAIALALALLLTRGVRRSVLPLPRRHLPARGPPDPGHQPRLPVGAQSRHRSAQRDVAGGRPGRPGAALADRSVHRPVERDRGRHLARRRLHHGHPHRRPDGHPGRVLRGRRASMAPPAGERSGTSRCHCWCRS